MTSKVSSKFNKPVAAWPSGSVGYVALLGRPNAGKSTLLNTVLDFHLAAVSAKPQTTRRQLLGISSGTGFQVMFLDTPGVHAPGDKLGEAMLEGVRSALRNADVVICLADPTRAPGAEDELVAKLAAECGKPVLLALNKADRFTADQSTAMRTFYAEKLPGVEVFSTAALQRSSLNDLLAGIKAKLPQGPFLYPPDTMTTSYERHIGAELIREVLLDKLRDEVPHATAVVIESWDEREDERHISAVLHVEREQQKAILIGGGGAVIKDIRKRSKVKLEELCGMPVFLELWVKVSKDWRKHRNCLQDFGYLGMGM